MKRLIIPLSLIIIIAAYFAVSAALYTQLSTVAPQCGGTYGDNTPAQFSAEPLKTGFDTAPYWMPDYETVEIPSRDAGITLNAWFISSGRAGAPTVLVTHGLGAGANDCKRNPRALMIAGMLHRGGYDVLLIDVREHGDSTVENGHWGGGSEEYRDILGAWDWLVTEKQIVPEQIGLVGYSGGSAATMIAFGEEPRVAAVWLDSVYADLNVTISDYLTRIGIPTIFQSGGLLIGRLFGDDMTAYSPISEVDNLAGRPVFITHSVDDQALPVDYARTLTEAIRAAGGTVDYWETSGSRHVQSMFDQPEAYEQRLIQFFDRVL